jgi:GTP-binding protein Era
MSEPYRSGFIALIGRPNVGKSTLLNALIGQKVSITSQRPQTTRHRILGIKTTGSTQFVYIDTPGLHGAGKKAINQVMNKAATGSLEGVDCVALVITAKGWTDADEQVLDIVRAQRGRVILVINKIDRLPDRAALLPLIEASQAKFPFAEIVPISAQSGANLDELEKTIDQYLPLQPPLFPEEQVTDRSERFLAAELVREQVFRSLGEEVPYACTVQVDQFKREKGLLRVEAIIWVEKEGQKAILIGKAGGQLKGIGQRAREQMERTFGIKVYLGLWVKVREGWSDDVRALRSLGYGEDG